MEELNRLRCTMTLLKELVGVFEDLLSMRVTTVAIVKDQNKIYSF